jgi:hypothetical protein
MYVYIYIYTHKYTYVRYISTYMHIYIHTCTYIHVHTYMYIHTCTYIHVHTYMYTYMYIHTCTYIHVHTYMYIPAFVPPATSSSPGRPTPGVVLGVGVPHLVLSWASHTWCCPGRRRPTPGVVLGVGVPHLVLSWASHTSARLPGFRLLAKKPRAVGGCANQVRIPEVVGEFMYSFPQGGLGQGNVDKSVEGRRAMSAAVLARVLV